MNKLTLRLIIAFLTFIIGIALVSVWFVSYHHSTETNLNGSIPVKHSQIEERRSYKDLDHARGMLRDGYEASTSGVESSDGMAFESIVGVFPSERDAQKMMNKILQKASGIIKREPLFDESGQRIGEKAIATFTTGEGATEYLTELLWTRGKEFRRIQSSSLDNVLEYEKDYDW